MSDDSGRYESDSERLIYHIFADLGMESEALSGYGRVVRVGIDPADTNESEPVKSDARALPLKPGADLAVLHPPCQRFSEATNGTGGPDDHPDMISTAREIGETYADDYIIENVPGAPLRDPVRLTGRMFGLPINFERHFETSFHVEQPPQYQDLVATDGPLVKDYDHQGQWVGHVDFWRAAKQVTGQYPAHEIKRECIPASYIHYLVYWWLRSEHNSTREVEKIPATDGGGIPDSQTTDRNRGDDGE